MKKRLWLPIIFLIVVLCVPVMAEDESVWNFDVGNYTIDGYTGAGGDVVVPDTIQGCPVEIIGTGAFQSSADITSLTLPETVELLEGSVGSWCDSLTSISLPQSLLVIGDGCFSSELVLEQVTIPSQVCYIGSSTFYFCSNLKSITFEGECPVIGLWAFTEISPDAVIYVPDDQLEAYTNALENVGCTAAVQPSGQNAAAREPIFDLENLPASVTDEEAAQFYNHFKNGNLGPIADESHVVREECTTTNPEEPNIKELMAFYDVVYDNSMEEEVLASAEIPA